MLPPYLLCDPHDRYAHMLSHVLDTCHPTCMHMFIGLIISEL